MSTRTVTVSGATPPWAQAISVGAHRFVSDEPVGVGTDEGPGPHELILAALGACTAMTLRMYAQRKGWPLDDVLVTLRLENDGTGPVVQRHIEFRGAIDPSQRARLLEIAGKCPVHRTLTAPLRIETTEC